jgi:hypothetical protein
MKTATVYVVGPQNTFAVDHREVTEMAMREDHPHVTHVARVCTYEELLER